VYASTVTNTHNKQKNGMNMNPTFNHDNKVYTVAVATKKDGPVALNLPLMVMEKAEATAKYMNQHMASQVSRIGLLCVAYNTTAKTMIPPYMINMEDEWNYMLDEDTESLYTTINTHAGGSI
tara:strand:+ start:504 stop:869 length:366 start_codon:yes stop_codon:yes gene_type:complete